MTWVEYVILGIVLFVLILVVALAIASVRVRRRDDAHADECLSTRLEHLVAKRDPSIARDQVTPAERQRWTH